MEKKITIKNSGIEDLDILKKIETDRSFRIRLARESFQWFFIIYLNHYVKYTTAEFQKEMFRIAQDESIRLGVIVAFRGSAKSTIMTLAYPIWSIIGRQQKKFPLIVCFTQQRAQDALSNIRLELEKYDLLNFDFGPFYINESWRDNTLVLSKYKAKITAVSTNENIRGIRNGAIRPDLIVCDDIEDTQSTRTKEGRDKNWQFINGEVFPTGDINTKKIIIGNLVHEDSTIMRLNKVIMDKKMEGIFKAYPLVSDKNEILWKEKFQDMKAVEKFRKSTVGSDNDWHREYLLEILPSTDQIIIREWIRYYDQTEVPINKKGHYETATGVDLAISEKASADYTALVTVSGYKINNEPVIFIYPNPINKRLNFPDAINQIISLKNSLGGNYSTKFYIESVGYQPALGQELELKGIIVEGVNVNVGKRERLASVSHWVRDGKIRFPKQGCEELIQQILGFGVEKHDDLVDAFTIVCSKLMVLLNKPDPQIYVLSFKYND